MKSILLLILIIILVGGGYYLFRDQTLMNTPAPASAPTPTLPVQVTPSPQVSGSTNAFCIPSQITASLDPEVAAGNFYATITMKNISQATCQVVGNNTLEVGYPISVKNFQTITKGQATTPVFTLEPNQTIYSLIHFPNGPQCSSMATQVNAMVSYDISPNNTVTFTPTMGSTLSIPSCGKASEITSIDLYPFSTEEVTP